MSRRYGQASALERDLLDVYDHLTSQERRITHAKIVHPHGAHRYALRRGVC
jgi:hypothetical protein